jgi:hypothetical protein
MADQKLLNDWIIKTYKEEYENMPKSDIFIRQYFKNYKKIKLPQGKYHKPIILGLEDGVKFSWCETPKKRGNSPDWL